MLPPSRMNRCKKGRHWPLVFAASAAAFWAGCGPPGARDLREGQRLLDEHRFKDAIVPLSSAAQTLATAPRAAQARALNLLGVAYAGAGDFDSASQAYLQALKLDRDEAVVDFNLGCLRAMQGNYPGAIDYLTTYATLQSKDAAGRLQLGLAWYHYALQRTGSERTRDLEFARQQVESSERLAPSAGADNALGMLALSHRYAGAESIRAAAVHFQNATVRDPNFAPALLNLAIVQQQYLNQPRDALKNYRAYLALQPAPPHASEVGKLVHELDIQTRVTIAPHRTEQPPPATLPQAFQPAYRPRIIPAPVAAAPIANSGPATSTGITAPPPAPAPEPTLTQAAPTPAPPPETPRPASVPVQQPQTATAKQTPATSPPITTRIVPEEESIQSSPPPSSPPPRKTLVQKLNPLHWFGGKSTPAPSSASTSHYRYLPSQTFIPGNRAQAEKWAQQGVEARHHDQLADARRDYQKAIEADPTCYPARLLLGMAAVDARDYPAALRALDGALQLQGDSADARYAFAWTLQKEGYYDDAIQQLEKLLTFHPNLASAHLLLGNLYADHFGDDKLARSQYQEALALDPHTPQADSLRHWLAEHP